MTSISIIFVPQFNIALRVSWWCSKCVTFTRAISHVDWYLTGLRLWAFVHIHQAQLTKQNMKDITQLVNKISFRFSSWCLWSAVSDSVVRHLRVCDPPFWSVSAVMESVIRHFGVSVLRCHWDVMEPSWSLWSAILELVESVVSLWSVVVYCRLGVCCSLQCSLWSVVFESVV
jgi:hypothetical protein